ncbi:PhoH family protein [Hujiaoplasma nucleasis]|uniref:PhoH-like protein n=1 Tax=Hujiaoplasma nucleasis TaxID=2725268 RepID=A0A7L6N2X2_9MOLU|nr:PhoH family protein [Hujiaoplasma nucleasis]QLY39568.1 PhoH family protein [Hujiaoplasma nucleasis]
MTEKLNINIELNQLIDLLGVNDKNIQLLKQLLDIEIYSNHQELVVETDSPEKLEWVHKIIRVLLELIHNNIVFNERDIIYIYHLLAKESEEDVISLFLSRKEIIKTFTGKPIYPKTFNQKKYIEMIENNTLIFGIGPAGTGKTYLAVLMAIKQLKNNKVKRIILTRPAVEAGEKLGFLPGDLKEKVDPYLRPLYDALYDVLGPKDALDLLDKQVIEIAPLAYMRGRTLDNAFVILDEAQNTTINQMKLFLTRLGFGSKMVVNGDITQIDLPSYQSSGLIKAKNILNNIHTVALLNFDKTDVVRHPLVQTIIERFENDQH